MTLTITRACVTIAASNWQQSIHFYQTLLNLAPQAHQPDRYAEFRLSDLTLVLYSPKNQEAPQPQSYPSLSLCLYVQDLDQAVQLLNKTGQADWVIQTSSHGREIYATDPDGNRVILYEPAV
jgi:catechol 2,3-dioxygenase-like lactoylglutathione lyase family enzyme